MITKVTLDNFRNFKKKIFSFSPKISIIIGPNASGKTNILEGIYLLSTGKSFKARLEEEMVNYDEEVARVKGDLLEAVLTRGEIRMGTTRVGRAPRKKLFINGVPRRMVDFTGKIKMVLFGPQDLDLVTESPSIRRKFLDNVLSQVDREYQRMLMSYEKGLRQRNKLLLRIREEGVSRSQLLFWNQLLVKCGDYISEKREKLINFINEREGLNSQHFEIKYDKSVISEGRLEQYKEEEVAAATTLVGPHRDDFSFEIKTGKGKTRNLASYGSRGEQRMGILWLKLAELTYIEKTSGEKPTLLLDDIFSELDHEHRDVVMELAHNQQTIITTADEHFVVGFGKVEKTFLK
jgi:DNA replication and repair protein RecF